MKIILRVSALVVAVTAVYYFFFLPYEFKVNFSSKTLPGDVIQTLRIWNRSLDSTQIVEVDSFNYVKQRVFIQGREYIYKWEFDQKDSSTTVHAKISEPAHKLYNKLMVLIGEPPIEKSGGEQVKKFYDVLKYHLNLTKAEVIGEETHASEFCLCRSIEKKQIEKAQGMMENYLAMTSFIQTSGLKQTGLPSVRLNKWSHNHGELKYDFCFPIAQTDTLPSIEGLEYRHFEAYNALKAIYNGNYITSDRAWYELYDYATKSGYKTSGLPVEYFFDNPNFGTKETEWKAEIFLPIDK